MIVDIAYHYRRDNLVGFHALSLKARTWFTRECSARLIWIEQQHVKQLVAAFEAAGFACQEQPLDAEPHIGFATQAQSGQNRARA